jgi:hypothetical protein
MKNIGNPTDFQELINRITLLSSAHVRRWGKMTVQEMLLHCTAQLKLALGEVKANPQGSFVLRTALGKWIGLSNIPWPKGANTPREMNMHPTKFTVTDLETEKKELLRYLNSVKAATELKPHPFFGALSRKEWDRLIYKHIDHHLTQFSQ